MHKFTIFTILFSVIVIVVIAELLVNDYIRKNPEENPGYASSITPNILEADQTDLLKTVPETAKTIPLMRLTADMLRLIGFSDPSIRTVDFNGNLFQMIDLGSFGIDHVLKANVFEGDEFRISINEIPFSSSALALEVYRLIGEEGEASLDITVNETNQYGNASLYLNHVYKKKTAFLVVVIGDTLYGFEYPHQSHEFVKGIIGELIL